MPDGTTAGVAVNAMLSVAPNIGLENLEKDPPTGYRTLPKGIGINCTDIKMLEQLIVCVQGYARCPCLMLAYNITLQPMARSLSGWRRSPCYL